MKRKELLFTIFGENLAYWAFILMGLFCVLTSCSARKHTLKVETQTHTVAKSDSTSATETVSETKHFGDSLKGNSYMPVENDSTEINVQSAGVKLNIKVKAKKNAAGKTVGHNIDYSAIAKPTAVTNTRQLQQTDVRKTSKKNEQTALIETEKKSGKLGWWVVWLALLILLIGFIVLKPLKFLR